MIELRVIDTILIRNDIAMVVTHDDKPLDELRKGSLLTDGINIHKVKEFALANYIDVASAPRTIAFTIAQGDFDHKTLEGKTLTLLPQ